MLEADGALSLKRLVSPSCGRATGTPRPTFWFSCGSCVSWVTPVPTGRHVATDDIGVAGVSVTIRNTTDNSIIEQGVALEHAGKWRYPATAVAPAGMSLTIEVTATDRPGNKIVKTANKP